MARAPIKRRKLAPTASEDMVVSRDTTTIKQPSPQELKKLDFEQRKRTFLRQPRTI